MVSRNISAQNVKVEAQVYARIKFKRISAQPAEEVRFVCISESGLNAKIVEEEAYVSTIYDDTDANIVEVAQSATMDGLSITAKNARVAKSVSTTSLRLAVQYVSNCAMKKQQKLCWNKRMVVQIPILMMM